MPIALVFDSGILNAKFAADEFPGDIQLRLAVHRNAKQIDVPFALRDIEVHPHRVTDP